MKLETLPSIHLIRGNIVHSVLEHFFSIDAKGIPKEFYKDYFRQKIQELLLEHWKKKEHEFEKLDLTKQELKFYFDESIIMLLSWLDNFCKKIEEREKDKSVHDAFGTLPQNRGTHIVNPIWRSGLP